MTENTTLVIFDRLGRKKARNFYTRPRVRRKVFHKEAADTEFGGAQIARLVGDSQANSTERENKFLFM